MSHKVFISYATPDAEFAQAIADRLERDGTSTYLDRRSIVAGQDFSATIQRELKEAGVVVAVLSANTQQSRWASEEVQAALEAKKMVVSVLLDDSAKNNWLWPLLADSEKVKLDLASGNASEQLDRVAQRVSAAVRAAMALRKWSESR